MNIVDYKNIVIQTSFRGLGLKLFAGGDYDIEIRSAKKDVMDKETFIIKLNIGRYRIGDSKHFDYHKKDLQFNLDHAKEYLTQLSFPPKNFEELLGYVSVYIGCEKCKIPVGICRCANNYICYDYARECTIDEVFAKIFGEDLTFYDITDIQYVKYDGGNEKIIYFSLGDFHYGICMWSS